MIETFHTVPARLDPFRYIGPTSGGCLPIRRMTPPIDSPRPPKKLGGAETCLAKGRDLGGEFRITTRFTHPRAARYKRRVVGFLSLSLTWLVEVTGHAAFDARSWCAVDSHEEGPLALSPIGSGGGGGGEDTARCSRYQRAQSRSLQAAHVTKMPL
jgi:hypothetical protein